MHSPSVHWLQRPWPYAVLMALSVSTTALAAPVIDPVVAQATQYPVPFQQAWLTVCLFAVSGGICSTSIKLEIDRYFWAAPLAKLFMGTMIGIGFAMWYTGELTPNHAETGKSIPPPFSAALIALFAGFTGAPIGQAALRFITEQETIRGILMALIRAVPLLRNFAPAPKAPAEARPDAKVSPTKEEDNGN